MTPKQNALMTYNFIRADYSEGLNYGVSVEAYNKCMEGIDSDKRIQDTVTAEKFLQDFYDAYHSLSPS